MRTPPSSIHFLPHLLVGLLAYKSLSGSKEHYKNQPVHNEINNSGLLKALLKRKQHYSQVRIANWLVQGNLEVNQHLGHIFPPVCLVIV